MSLGDRLARPGTGTRARAAPAHRDGAALVGAAPPHGVDARADRPAPPGPAGHDRGASARHTAPADRPPNRPGRRPPRQPRTRPRAAGMRAPCAARSRSAAWLPVCPQERTCVRTVGGRSDGTRANMCTHGSPPGVVLPKWLVQAVFGAHCCKRSCMEECGWRQYECGVGCDCACRMGGYDRGQDGGGWAGDCRGRVQSRARQVVRARARTVFGRWLLRLPGNPSQAARSGHGGASSQWRSSSSKVASPCPAR